jgi:hypothetical protein
MTKVKKLKCRLTAREVTYSEDRVSYSDPVRGSETPECGCMFGFCQHFDAMMEARS